MHKMKELREMLCRELESLTKKGELSSGSLDMVDKITHSIKSIDTIMAMEGYSNEYSNEGSYARGRYANRDSMGRYSRDGGSYGNGSYDGSYERGYSRDNREDEIRELKERLMRLEK